MSTSPKPLKKFQKPPEDTPVIASLASRMTIELMMDETGRALLLHRQELPEVIWWAEYDVELNSLYFVTIKGQLMGYGMKMPPALAARIIRVKDLWFMQVEEKDKKGIPQPVPLVVRHPESIERVLLQKDAEKAAKDGVEI